MRFLTIAFIFLAAHSGAQNVKIKGKAHLSHKNKAVELYSFSDLITYTSTKEAADTVDKNGYFEMELKIDHTQAVIVRIDNLVGKLYIQPDYVFGITFPSRDTVNRVSPEADETVNLGILSADTTELNTLIIDFNEQYEKFFGSVTTEFLVKKRIYQKTDSLKLISDKRYKNIKNPYFKKYLEYTFANINSNASRGKNYLAENYITGKPVLHHQFEYMEFFNAYFKGYLNAYSSKSSGENINHLINSVGRYSDLEAFMRNDPLLRNDTLRELVSLRNLWDYYYSPQFEKDQVVAIIEQFFETTKIAVHKKIATNMLQIAYKLQPGVAAPVFKATDRNGKTVSLADYKGRYVYINFFSAKSIVSLKEMPKIAELNKKYGDKVSFISICTDDSIKTFKAYLKANPKYNWQIVFNNSEQKGSTAKDLYNVKGVPAFFFINQFGNLMQSPAQPASQGFEYKLRALFKPKRSNTKIGIR